MNAGSIRRQGVRVYCSPAETQADTGWIFFREENHHVEINGRRSRRAVTSQPSPTTVPELSQTRERVRRRTIVNRQRSLKPFLAWLGGQGVPLSAVSPVVITKYFTCAVAGRLSGPASRSTYSLFARFFAMPAVEVGARHASLSPSTHPGSRLMRICRKGRRGKR
jgi:hypothetical protein